MITKKVTIELTKEELDNPEPIQIHLDVVEKDRPEEGILYTMEYPTHKSGK